MGTTVTPTGECIELSKINKTRDAVADLQEDNALKQPRTQEGSEHQTLPALTLSGGQQQNTQVHSSAGLARDFFALERTWLAYNRTANTLASHAIVVAQLFFLREGHEHIGIAFAVIMISGGIMLDLIGVIRYLVQSRALLSADPGTGRHGRAVLGNYSICPSAVIVGAVCCGLFVLVLVF